MSRLLIVHDTRYSYRKPVTFGPHRLVLRPREGHDLHVAAQTITGTPEFSIHWSRDVFGNSIAMLTPEGPSSILHIQSRLEVERSPLDGLKAPIGRVTYPVVYDPLEAAMVAPYLAPSYPDDEAAVRTFVFETLDLGRTGDVETALTRLNTEIKDRFSYQRREQRGVHTPAQLLERGTGSCRDKATLFDDCARALGIAARFVSGYIDVPAAEIGRASTHAWSEVYLPHNGWSGFDPTIGEPTSHKHVVLGVSHHPRGVMPISGTFTGDSGDYLGLEVAIKITKE